MSEPDMHYVESSSIEAIGYDAAASELHVRFLESGETYVYRAVPELVYRQLLRSDSKGTFVSERIRDEYDFRIL
jgi:KTSC domain